MHLSRARFAPLIVSCFGIVACHLDETTATIPIPIDPFEVHGIVTGLVTDTTGKRIVNATVCAVTTFSASGTPIVIIGSVPTRSDGSYVTEVAFTLHPPDD